MKIHHECELERHIVQQLEAGGWLLGESIHYDRARALYPEDVLAWLQASQPEAWDKLLRLHGGSADTAAKAVLDRLAKALEASEGGDGGRAAARLRVSGRGPTRHESGLARGRA
jgi:type I restriction enzyme R subunit